MTKILAGDRVKKQWPYDGTARAGQPFGPAIKVLVIRDHKPVDGPAKSNALAELEDGTCEFVWNITKCEPRVYESFLGFPVFEY